MWWLAACGPTAPPPPTWVEVTVEPDLTDLTYPVQGNDWKELMASVDEQAEANGVAGDTRRKFGGRTAWRFRWQVRGRRERGRCHAQISVGVKVTTILPAWTPPAEADPALIERWKRWSEGLARHEDVHEALALAAAEELRAGASSLVVGADCEARKPFDRVADEIVERHQQTQRRYDDVTDHGIHQERWTGQ